MRKSRHTQKTSLPLLIYRYAGYVLAPFIPIILKMRAKKGKEDLTRLSERLGYPSLQRPQGSLAWFHGASIGESLSLLSVIKALQQLRPDVFILVTSGTVTSAQVLAKKLTGTAVHQFLPIDTPKAARRFLEHWRPDLAVFAESDLWPNLLTQARQRGTRTALISARLSNASIKTWQTFPKTAKRLFGGFDLILAQDATMSDHLKSLGANLEDPLNLKWLGEPLDEDQAANKAWKTAIGNRPVFLAASTHIGEEKIILEAFSALMQELEITADHEGYQPAPLLVIVPRHIERGEAIAALASETGLVCARQGVEEPVMPKTSVLIADRLGELGLWFRIAQIGLIGGSLVPGIGGHNPLEAARLSCPILAGPFVENWTDIYQKLADVSAYQKVHNLEELKAFWRLTLQDQAAFQNQAERAYALTQHEQTGLTRLIGRLISLLPPETPC